MIIKLINSCLYVIYFITSLFIKSKSSTLGVREVTSAGGGGGAAGGFKSSSGGSFSFCKMTIIRS